MAARQLAALETLLVEPCDARLHTEREAGCRLRVEVPEKDPLPGRGGQIRQVHRRRGLTDASFHVVDGDGPHRARPPASRFLERAAASRSCGASAESGQRVDYLSAQAIPPLTRLLCQASQSEQRAWRPSGGAQCAATVEQSRLLHLRVVEVAEDALQLLQGAEDAVEICRRRKRPASRRSGTGASWRRSAPREVAQARCARRCLLRCWRFAGSAATLVARRRLRGGVPRFGPRPRGAPVGSRKPPNPKAAAGSDRCPARRRARRCSCCCTWPRNAISASMSAAGRSPVLSEREHEHVNVAQRAGEATQPRELRREVRDRVGLEHVLDLAEQRARASERHAEIVEKLRVEIRAETGLVGGEGAEQARGGSGGPRRRRRIVGVEVHPGRRRRRRVPGAPSWRSITPSQTVGAGPNARATLDHGHELLVDVFVTAQAVKVTMVGSGCQAPCDRGSPDVTRFDSQAGDRLAAAIEDLEERPARLRVDLCEQPPHANHRRHRLLQRTIRKIPGEAHRLFQPDRQAGSSAAGPPRQQRGAVAAGPSQPCSRSSDTAVERVQQGKPVPDDRMMTRRQERLQTSGDRLRRQVARDNI